MEQEERKLGKNLAFVIVGWTGLGWAVLSNKN